MNFFHRNIIEKFFLFVLLPIMALSVVCLNLFTEEDTNAVWSDKEKEYFYYGQMESDGEFSNILSVDDSGADFDGDGVANIDEVTFGSSIYSKDSDEDGVYDNVEFHGEAEKIPDNMYPLINRLPILRKINNYFNMNFSNFSYEPQQPTKKFAAFQEATGFTIDQNNSTLSENIYFSIYSGKAFDGVKIIGKPFTIHSKNNDFINLKIPYSKFKKAKDFNTIFFDCYNLKTGEYRNVGSAYFEQSIYYESYDKERNITVSFYSNDENEVYCFYLYNDKNLYNEYNENSIYENEIVLMCDWSNSESYFSGRSVESTLLMNNENIEGKFAVAYLTSKGIDSESTTYIFYCGDATQKDLNAFSTMASDRFARLFRVGESTFANIEKVSSLNGLNKAGKIDDAETSIIAYGKEKDFFLDKLCEWLAEHYTVTVYGKKTFADMVRLLMSEEDIETITTEADFPPACSSINTNFDVKLDTFSFSSCTVNKKNISLGMADFVSNYYNYGFLPYYLGTATEERLKTDGISSESFFGYYSADNMSRYIRICTDESVLSSLAFRSENILGCYLGAETKKFDHGSIITSIIKQLKNDKVVTCYISGQQNIGLVVYGIYRDAVNPSIYKLKVYDPTYVGNSMVIYDNNQNVMYEKKQLAEITLYSKSTVFLRQDDKTGENYTKVESVFTFEYGDKPSYHFGNTGVLKNNCWYSGNQIFFRVDSDMSLQADKTKFYY